MPADGPDQLDAPEAEAGDLSRSVHDDLPYVSLPIVYAQPARLAALAALHGLAAPPAERARVLELGCASGGNIVPLAARYPEAGFLGIDLSRQHVDQGNARIGALGLANIELRHGDLAGLAAAGRRFDYVVCHGVYSWVPPATQDAILRICAATLADDGLAAISYNVLPGWHLRSVVRDACLIHAGREGEPHGRVAKARAILAVLAEATSDTGAYGQILRAEAERLMRQPASYILGEFLADHNAPCHFREFAARAAAHGLGYVCEGDLPASIPELAAPRAAAGIASLAGEDRLLAQQYVDLFSGRTFRRSILARAPRLDTGLARPGPGRIAALHVASRLRYDASRSAAGASTFSDHRGRTITVKKPAVRHALGVLAGLYPATAATSDLIRADAEPADDKLVRDALYRLVETGRATVSTLPLAVGRAADDRPVAWMLARQEAASGQPWITTLRHTGLPLDPALAHLLPLIDGTRDRRQLAAGLATAIGSATAGKLRTFIQNDQPANEPIEATAARRVERALAVLEINAVLVPAAT